MSTINYLVGDVRDRVADLADGSVSLIVTSPPFLALRSYLPADHPLKHAEIGSEPDPAAFIDCLLAQVAQWATKLAPWGSIAVELGDTYAGSGGAGGDYNADGLRAGQGKADGSARRGVRESGWHRSGQDTSRTGPRYRQEGTGWSAPNGGSGWPSAKSACFIPELFGIALAYGINPLTGQASPAGRWLVRNKIVWARPNPPVGSLGDKFRTATSLIVVATRDPRRWFDLDAVRTPVQHPDKTATTATGGHGRTQATLGPYTGSMSAGAPPLDWHIDGDHDGWDVWRMSTQPYPGSHYATFPAELPRRLIASMCPTEVCATCGTPRRRVVGRPHATGVGMVKTRAPGHERVSSSTSQPDCATPVTLGWTDCGHDDYTPGVVLDPFAGSGTTLAVAAELGRDAIGIDIDDRNVYLARQRVGEHAHVRQDTRGDADWTWTCDPRLPNQAAQLDGQLSMLGGEA